MFIIYFLKRETKRSWEEGSEGSKTRVSEQSNQTSQRTHYTKARSTPQGRLFRIRRGDRNLPAPGDSLDDLDQAFKRHRLHEKGIDAEGVRRVDVRRHLRG